MTRKLRYRVDLSHRVPVDASHDLPVRPVSVDDLDALARLMLDAYFGTIDYDGETLDEALEEVRAFLDSQSSLLDRSFVVVDHGRIVSGVLVSRVEGKPFIGYVMTVPSHKNQGLARMVTSVAMDCLAEDGYTEADLYITEGNIASEALFRSVGAVRFGDESA